MDLTKKERYDISKKESVSYFKKEGFYLKKLERNIKESPESNLIKIYFRDYGNFLDPRKPLMGLRHFVLINEIEKGDTIVFC